MINNRMQGKRDLRLRRIISSIVLERGLYRGSNDVIPSAAEIMHFSALAFIGGPSPK